MWGDGSVRLVASPGHPTCKEMPMKGEGDFVIDHLRYITERRYRREIRFALRKLSRKGRRKVTAWRVLHEADLSCERREPWTVTARRMVIEAAKDGERVAWLTAEGLMVGNPDGERDAQQLRDRLRELAGGQINTPGPTMLAVRDRVLEQWYAAGGARCMHAVTFPEVHILMAHAPDLARCSRCIREYAMRHAGEASEELTCDCCWRLSHELGTVAGPWYGILVTFVACPECFAKIEVEVAA